MLIGNYAAVFSLCYEEYLGLSEAWTAFKERTKSEATKGISHIEMPNLSVCWRLIFMPIR